MDIGNCAPPSFGALTPPVPSLLPPVVVGSGPPPSVAVGQQSAFDETHPTTGIHTAVGPSMMVYAGSVQYPCMRFAADPGYVGTGSCVVDAGSLVAGTTSTVSYTGEGMEVGV